MHYRGLVISVLVACASLVAMANERVVDDLLEQIALQLGDDEELDVSAAYDDLIALLENPIDLNSATKQQLEQLFFLSDVQIENLLYYQYRYGEIYSVHELALVEGIDDYLRSILQHFVCVRPKEVDTRFSAAEVFRYGKHEVYVRNGATLEPRRGFSKSIANGYLGDPIYASLKYQFHYKDNVYFGFAAEKDMGEPFATSLHKGFDSYNGYVQLNRVWGMKAMLLGDYRAVFGQGLVMRTEFNMPDASLVHISPRRSGLRRCSSTDEFNFLRGVGATYAYKGLDVSLFYAYRQLDADTSGGVFSSIATAGLHRKASEWSKRHTLPTHVVGANVAYDGRSWHVGLTSSTVLFARERVYDGQLCKMLEPYGKVQAAVGVDYRARLHRFFLFGEVAANNNRGVALINGVLFYPSSLLGVTLSHRYYSPRYSQLFANGFGAGDTNNEHGVYLGLELLPVRHLSLSFAANAYKRVWSAYQANGSPMYCRINGRLEYKPLRNLTCKVQLSYREREANSALPFTVKALEQTDVLKHVYSLYYSLLGVDFKSAVAVSHAKVHGGEATHGVVLQQTVAYAVPRIALKLNAGYVYFDAVNYNNRFALYESDVPMVFSLPTLYGKGCRYYLNVGFNAHKVFSVWVKFAQTHYTDGREQIGSGLDEIRGAHKSDVRVLVRFKF